ncbi:carboxylesterase 4A [Antechinus flavipes]|uniref:carboxylesterase 4A n=1 Tax=Antechinus flavipes TaxID=38775 RepID=UPI002235B700|nr:carboxylesterase 4A [Antechinus flavipes]
MEGSNGKLLSAVESDSFKKQATQMNHEKENPCSSGRPVAVTKYGVLLGKQTRVGGKTVNVYLGVPFAKPPVGKLRFAPPEPPEPWNNLRNAVTYPPACIQQYWGQIAHLYFTTQKYQTWLKFQEDCLYLNIYTPAHAQKKSRLPVMVWFPGGAFVIGAASTYDGSVLSAYEDVVVVSIQNRLGILGFLSTGDAHARGNWALLDQIAALRWVQENIAGFGGDPSSVTLFGQSSGAICISGLILSPLSKGLFHRAISQSGTALLKFFISYDPLKIAKRIAKVAQCETNSTQVLVQCLRSKTEAEIQKVSNEMNFFRLNFTDNPQETLWFVPAVVDGVVFPDSPEALLAQGNFRKVPYLLGVNNIEFNWLLPYIMHVPIQPHIITRTKVVELLWNFSVLLVRSHLRGQRDKTRAEKGVQGSLLPLLFFQNITKDQIPLVVKEYIGDFNFQGGKLKQLVEIRNNFLELAGDGTFLVASIQMARHHRDAGLPVYFYEFTHHVKARFIIKARTDVADHGDEIGFILGAPLHNGFATEEEKRLSRNMMKYWANFARTGDPNSHGLLEWPRYENEEKYLLLDLKQSVGIKLKEKKVAFWNRIQNHHHKQPQHGREV